MEIAKYPLEKAVKGFFDKAVNMHDYQARNGQNKMAMEVIKVVTKKNFCCRNRSWHWEVLCLVPVSIQYFRECKQVIIATSTIALQEQLYRNTEKVMKLLGVNAEMILVKDIKNYLCMKRLSNFHRWSDNLCLKIRPVRKPSIIKKLLVML
ncbi:MAG: hypothetical protein K2K06_00405 [Oscillospiraceae bacterium]|nr:hypothetical protein [Oscillospiraceae bacterium]